MTRVSKGKAAAASCLTAVMFHDGLVWPLPKIKFPAITSLRAADCSRRLALMGRTQ